MQIAPTSLGKRLSGYKAYLTTQTSHRQSEHSETLQNNQQSQGSCDYTVMNIQKPTSTVTASLKQSVKESIVNTSLQFQK